MADAKFDIKTEATRPFYAAAGAADLGVEVARKYVSDVQTLVSDVQKKVTSFEFEPKTLNEKAVAEFSNRRAELTKDVKEAQAKLESRFKDLQTELQGAKALPAKLQTVVADVRKQAGDFEVKTVQAKAEARLKELQSELKEAQAKLEARVSSLQADAKALPAKLQAEVAKVQAEVKDLVADVTKAYDEIIKRGEAAVAKLRKVEAKVEETVAAPAAKKPAAKKAPPKKAAAKKAPAKKAAAKA